MKSPGRTDAPADFGLQMRRHFESLAMVGAATMAGLLIAPRSGTAAIDLLYLVPVLASARLFGLAPSLVAGLASALAYNFFFTEPVHSLRIDEAGDLVTVAMLLAVAIVTSQLASRMREQTRLAVASAARNATIAGFAGRLLSCSTPAQIGEVACGEINALFGCNAILVDNSAGEVAVVAAAPPGPALTPNDLATAAWVLEHGVSAGRGSPRLSPAEGLFHPICSGARGLGAIGLARDDGRPCATAEQQDLLENLLDQTALALARSALEDEVTKLAHEHEHARLRQVMLSSLGHDLRTPLTAIVAAAEELNRQSEPDPALVEMVEVEARRLERYVTNILDMARLEAGALALRTEPIDLVEAVAAARHDLRSSLAGRRISVDVPTHLPLIRADAQLLHHCLINLLDNAARHSGGLAAVHVSARQRGREVILEVEDEGPGLPAEGGGEVFARFARLTGSDRKGGVGLGLAIVRGFAELMGMRVSASNRADRRGAVFRLHFPAELMITPKEEAGVE